MPDIETLNINGDSYTLSDTAARALIEAINNSKSHVGMIVQSTALDTQEKVIEAYGGSEWSRLDDMFLVGAGTSYDVNSTGGNADSIIPYHSHSIPALSGTAASSGSHYHFSTRIGNGSVENKSNVSYGVSTFSTYSDYKYSLREIASGTWTGATTSTGAHTHSVTTVANNTGKVGTEGNTIGANLPPIKLFIFGKG